MSGNGDPFASLIYRPILMNLAPNPKLVFKIMTNGLLLKKLLKKTAIYNNIEQYSISIDAGDAETYKKVRVNGSWESLIENLNFLKLELEDNKFVNLNFCLHNENLDSLNNFVELVGKYQWNGTIQSLEDWGSYKYKKFFNQQNVLDKRHNLFPLAIKKLKMISTNKNVFLVGKIQELVKNN